MPGLAGGAHDLADEALRFTAAAANVLNATGADAQLVVAGRQWAAPIGPSAVLAHKELIWLAFLRLQPAGFTECLALWIGVSR